MLEHLLKAKKQGATEGGDGARRDAPERNPNAGLEVSPPPRAKARGDCRGGYDCASTMCNALGFRRVDYIDGFYAW